MDVGAIEKQKYRILFVCMGNICRSPAGEGVMRALVEKAGLSGHVEIASAGTIGLHAGELPDARMRAAAARRGYELKSRARQVASTDLDHFDLILTMDENNRRNVLALAESDDQRTRVRRFVDFCSQHQALEVPDPYYGGEEGFDEVLDLLEDGCQGVLDTVRSAKS
ncbi:MAG TPA: low molecular weight protein-tyrosine-phosphatase [Rariglobus sp.]|nr:low molecular weight protein-tyrosine-phosphatase [Rariglobus sp.]